MSLLSETHALPCSARDLRRLLRVRDSVVDFKPLERCGLCRVQPELPSLLAEEIALFWMVIEAAGLHFFSPASDFLCRFLLAVLIEPFDDLLVPCSRLDLRFEIVALYAFETEKHIVERTIKMVLADVPRHQGAALINCPAKNRVTPDANARTARRLFC